MRKLVALLLGFTLAGICAAQSKPNIVLLFIDDWAWNGTPIRMDDEMANSKMPVLKMPNLEKLKNEGMKCTGHDKNCVTMQPFCGNP